MQSSHINQPIVVWLLSDWQPQFTIRTLSATLVMFSLICAAVAAITFIESGRIVEMKIRYDNRCSGSSCVISESIKEPMTSPIALYYRLTDFNQNTRAYSGAYSTSQVQSDDQTSYDPSTCGGKFSKSPVNGLVPYPCGLLPYSFFNDEFNISVVSKSGSQFNIGSSYLTGPITWKNEMDKYTIRSLSIRETRQIKRDNKTILLPLMKDAVIQNWMKPAAHSTFRKLYQLMDISLDVGDNLTIVIDNNFLHPIANGEKWIVLSTVSWMGAKNQVIPWIYSSVSASLLLTAISLLSIYRYKLHPTKPS